MRLVSPFLKKVVYPSFSAMGVFHRNSGKGLAVVTYHGVLPREYDPVDPSLDGNLVTAELLGEQLRFLKARYQIVDPEQVLAWNQGSEELPARAVLVTCDDGLRNNFTDMLPVLRQERVKCLFFVTGASAGEERRLLWYEELFLLFLRAKSGAFEVASGGITINGELGSREQRRTQWWDSVRRLSQVDADARDAFLHVLRQHFGIDSHAGDDSAWSRRFGLMNREELEEMVSAGMAIGGHTMSHPVLSEMNPELAHIEVSECRAKLESVLRSSVWAFAYPFGDAASVSPEVLRIPEEAGYKMAFLNYGGGLGIELPVFAMPRIHVTSQMKRNELDAHVSGFYAGLQHRFGRSA